MKKLFAIGVVGLILFEIANVYFIMPMPYSQRTRSIDLAYALYSYRWLFRIGFGALMLAGLLSTWRAGWAGKVMAAAAIIVATGVTYVFNFRMAADHMFLQPTVLSMQPAAKSTVEPERLVVGVELDGDARAYPLQFIGYHHHVRDTVGGRDILVSYCTVCRTGRVFSPQVAANQVAGKTETFRLVGMDHFNAMLEDASTGSWWRQANGEAIVGPRKGEMLPEIPSVQVTLKQWLALHPTSLIMQGDPKFESSYAKGYGYERGTSRSTLTGTDSTPWQEKSWVVGITSGKQSKAFDWQRLKKERVINDAVGDTPVVIALAGDSASFFAFKRPHATSQFTLRGDSLVSGENAYDLKGHGANGSLQAINASQEFWHSWRTFHPGTEKY